MPGDSLLTPSCSHVALVVGTALAILSELKGECDVFCLLFSFVDYVTVKGEIIKDTWTKSGGMVGVGEGGGFSWGGGEGRGEKAYNCN